MRISAAPEYIFRTAIAAAVMAAGSLLAWHWTGNLSWITAYFDFLGTPFLLTSAAAELFLAYYALRHFAPGEPLHQAWVLLTFAASCRLAGNTAAHVLATGTAPTLLRKAGLAAGGPLQMVLLSAGLWILLQQYRRLGYRIRITPIEWLALALVAGYTLYQPWQLLIWWRSGLLHSRDWLDAVNWSSDLLLSILLLQAILLRRYAHAMGGGLIAKCWTSYAAGVFLTSFGNLGIWATATGVARWPGDVYTWYLWIFPAAAYALGPAYQVAALGRVWDRAPLRSAIRPDSLPSMR